MEVHMAYGGGSSAAAMAAAIARAIKASGAIVQVEPEDFLVILSKAENPLSLWQEAVSCGRAIIT